MDCWIVTPSVRLLQMSWRDVRLHLHGRPCCLAKLSFLNDVGIHVQDYEASICLPEYGGGTFSRNVGDVL